ncbi:MAG: L,D-transpeptidase family protein [Hyphomicrobium sp.]|nr:L,D-transpeptidase family protein [Hyphomicrobium sp.]
MRSARAKTQSGLKAGLWAVLAALVPVQMQPAAAQGAPDGTTAATSVAPSQLPPAGTAGSKRSSDDPASAAAGSTPPWQRPAGTAGSKRSSDEPTSATAAPPASAAPGTAGSGTSQSTTAATTDPASPAPGAPSPAAAPVAEAPKPTPPTVLGARTALADPAFVARAHPDDVTAAIAFYGSVSAPIWVKPDAIDERGLGLISAVKHAPEWGLDASDYPLPSSQTGIGPDQIGKVEAQLTLTALSYARHARGGRVQPSSVSQLFDLTPPIKDPSTVLAGLATAGDAKSYLEGLHPKHPQFVKLQKALVAALGGPEPETPKDPALTVRLPAKGATVKPGSLHPDIALLRQRLSVPATVEGQETLLDDKLATALIEFQTQNGLKANGALTPRTRQALNAAIEPPREKGSEARRIALNMERWRWMPENLGAFHVLNNVPEFTTRTFKNDKVVFQEKIVVGLPEWPTPSFSAEMKTIEYNPSWGVPDGIREKELKPRLKRAGGGGFFDQLFGGGGGGSQVLRAYGLTAYRNGKPVNPDSVDWSSADLRQYSFIQPPGEKNPLGFVKFMFPNTHDVYMHDTVARELFQQSRRAYSHGCIRVQNPQRFAEVLLAEDKGWSSDRVASARRSSERITLDRHIWVHNVYMTAWVQDDGKLSTFGDLYGMDSRLSTALGGRPIPSFENRQDDVETASIAEDGGDPGTVPPGEQKKKKSEKKDSKKAAQSKYSVPRDLSEAMSGLYAN